MAKQFSVSMLKKGKGNAISAAQLAAILETDKRTVCSEIEAARRNGALICSGNAGYYIPEKKAELQETYAIMRKRALSMLFTMKATKRAIEEWTEADGEADPEAMDPGSGKA